MDTQQLVKDVKARFNINYQKHQLHEKYTAKLIFADQGGLWAANPNLLSQLSSSDTPTLILLDNYENPIKVDRLKLFEKANELYVSTMKDWHSEYETLKNKR
jgi:hypothetical protein